MPRNTSDRWNAAMEGDATGEQPLTLLTITHPEITGWHLKVVNDQDWFARDAGLSGVNATLTFVPSSMRFIATQGALFFIPTSPPQNDFMSVLAFFKIETDTIPGLNDGIWQIKTIESATSVIVYPRRTMESISPATGKVYYMETFRPLNFIASKPTEKPNEVPTISLKVAFNDPSLIAQLRSLSSAPRVVVETVLRSEPDYVQHSTPPLEWTVMEFDRNTISGSISGPSALNFETPHDSKTPYLRPGLYNLI